jgi:hypothetical protein
LRNKSKSPNSFVSKGQYQSDTHFYERYESLAKYDNIVSQLKIATVSYGYRPRLWGEDKTIKEIENIFSYLSEWKEMVKKSNNNVAINIDHDHNFIGNLLICYNNDKY